MPPLLLVLLASIIYTPQLIYLEIRKSGLRLKYDCFDLILTITLIYCRLDLILPMKLFDS